MGLEVLILLSEPEQDWVLEVCWEDDVLVSGLARQLDTQIPRSQGNEGKGWRSTRTGVLVNEMLLGVLVECSNSVAEGASVLHMLPGKSGKGCTKRRDRSVDWADEHGLAVQL